MKTDKRDLKHVPGNNIYSERSSLKSDKEKIKYNDQIKTEIRATEMCGSMQQETPSQTADHMCAMPRRRLHSVMSYVTIQKSSTTVSESLSPGGAEPLQDGYLRSLMASSIFDLSHDAKQLEHAIKNNDVSTLRRILEVHTKRKNPTECANGFVVPDPCTIPNLGDDRNLISNSYNNVCNEDPSNDSETNLSYESLESHSYYICDSKSKRFLELADISPIFWSSLHVAVHYQNDVVLSTLLRHGVDPRWVVPENMFPGVEGSGELSSSASNTRCGVGSVGIRRRAHTGESFTELARRRKDVRFLLSSKSGNFGKSGDHFRPKFIDGATGCEPACCSDRKARADSSPVSAAAASSTSSSPPESPSPVNSFKHLGKHDSALLRATYTTHGHRLGSRDIDSSPPQLSFASAYSLDVLHRLPVLFLAVALRNAKCVRLLLESGAPPNIQDRNGCTPLHLAASVTFQSWDCALELIARGAKVHIRNKYGVSPSDLSPDLAKEQVRLLTDTLHELSHLLGRHRLAHSPGGRVSVSLQRDPSHGSQVSDCSGGLGARFFKRLNSESIFSKPRPDPRRRSKGSVVDITRDASSCSSRGVVSAADSFADRVTSWSAFRDRGSSVGSHVSCRHSSVAAFTSSCGDTEASDMESSSGERVSDVIVVCCVVHKSR